MSELSDNDSPAAEPSSPWVSLAEIVGAWMLIVAFVGLGGLFALSFFWHPDDVQRTTPSQSDVLNFETKASWVMVIL
jgi:hypothetical protein